VSIPRASVVAGPKKLDAHDYLTQPWTRSCSARAARASTMSFFRLIQIASLSLTAVCDPVPSAPKHLIRVVALG